MTEIPTGKLRLWAFALFNSIFNSDEAVSLVKLVKKPKNIPYYNRQGVPGYWSTSRTAAFYIQRVFEDDADILHKLGIKPENIMHVFWEAYSGGTNLGYYDIWKNNGLNPNGPKPYENKVDSRSPATRYGGFSGFFSPNCIILELGSGEGVALAQFYNGLNHRDQISWIGIDSRYQAGKIDTGKRGELQFVQDDFHKLEHVPDASIDRILSIQSAFLHGDASRVSEQLTRVSKQGAILRAQPLMDYLKNAVNSLTANGWDVYTIGEDSLAARLK
jgi:hypothetical protein